MSESTCPSISPGKHLCTRPAGHGDLRHYVEGTPHVWHGGLDAESRWLQPAPTTCVRNYMTEGEWLAYGRHGY